jgi:hypothetical protein
MTIWYIGIVFILPRKIWQPCSKTEFFLLPENVNFYGGDDDDEVILEIPADRNVGATPCFGLFGGRAVLGAIKSSSAYRLLLSTF